MIVMLEGVRSGRVEAMRALRTLQFWLVAEEDDDKDEPFWTYGKPYNPGINKVLDMINSIPIRIKIMSEDLSKFEEYFHTKILSNPPNDYIQPGDCVGGPDIKVPWAVVKYPRGKLSVFEGVKELADTIYRLLEDGCPEDKITIEPSLVGNGPIKIPYGIA